MKVHDEMLKLSLLLDGSTELLCPKSGGPFLQGSCFITAVIVIAAVVYCDKNCDLNNVAEQIQL